MTSNGRKYPFVIHVIVEEFALVLENNECCEDEMRKVEIIF